MNQNHRKIINKNWLLRTNVMMIMKMKIMWSSWKKPK